MKNLIKIVGIIVIVAMIGFSLLSCQENECTSCNGTGNCYACGGNGRVDGNVCGECYPTGSGKCRSCDGDGYW